MMIRKTYLCLSYHVIPVIQPDTATLRQCCFVASLTRLAKSYFSFGAVDSEEAGLLMLSGC